MSSTLLQNLDESLPALLSLVQAGAYMLGVMYITIGISAAVRKSSDPRGVPGARPIASTLSGGALIAIGTVAAAFVESATGDGWNVVPQLSHFATAQNANVANMQVLLKVVQLFGYLGVIRGVMLWNKAGESAGGHNAHQADDQVLSGAVYCFFGAMGINILGVLRGVSSFTGLQLPSFLM